MTPEERRFAPIAVRQRRNAVRYGLEQLSDIIGIRTNHLEALDEAIRNRPVRFNRKYRFQDPTNEQIDQLQELYFGAALIPPQLKRICHDQGFTGAHISEVKRTTELLAHKRRLLLPEVFADAVQVVQVHFSPKTKQVGFGVG